MKKIISTLAVLAFALGLASADVQFNFYNKLYEEDPFVTHKESADENGKEVSKTKSDFMGIINRMYFEVFTDRVDAMVKADVRLDVNDAEPFETDHLYLEGRIKDWYLEFRPIEPVTLSLHTGIFADGSYLPVYDDCITASNIGSDGFTLAARPVEGLRLAFSLPFGMNSDSYGWQNYINGDKDKGEANPFDFRLGAIYGQELFQIGLSIQDVADNDQRKIGAYINLPTLFGASDKLTVGAGFAHSEEYSGVVSEEDSIWLGNAITGDVYYKNLLSAYATLDFDSLSFAAESTYNLSDDNEEASYDLYAAANVSFGISDKLSAGVTGKILADLASKGEKNKEMLFGAIGLGYDVNDSNSVGIEFNIAKQDKNWAVAIPVYWKYHFEK